jgi:DNA-binding MarR family transcriptional regulator
MAERKTTDSVDGRSMRVSLTAEARRLAVRITGESVRRWRP